MYPTAYLVESLGYDYLESRRSNDQLVTVFKMFRGIIDSPDLYNKLARHVIPSNYSR